MNPKVNDVQSLNEFIMPEGGEKVFGTVSQAIRKQTRPWLSTAVRESFERKINIPERDVKGDFNFHRGCARFSYFRVARR